MSQPQMARPPRVATRSRMAATIAQNPREMGRLAMLTAARVLAGETVPAEQPVSIALVPER